MPVVAAFLIDDENEQKFWSHNLVHEDVVSVLDCPVLIARNRGRRWAPYVVIGRDRSGRCLTIPIEATHLPERWRPVTAWPCKAAKETALRKSL